MTVTGIICQNFPIQPLFLQVYIDDVRFSLSQRMAWRIGFQWGIVDDMSDFGLSTVTGR